jgi:dTDP-4-amino-4,6-dideoxygalactose transaminase
VIYDAAHCFDVKHLNKSVFEYGDISICSFHATKIFHTGEGGAIFCNDEDLFKKVFYSHNFGHNGPTEFHGLGINGKISELQAAMGLAVLPYIDQIINSRKLIVDYYNEHIHFDTLKKIKIRENTSWNNSYYPIIFQTEELLITAQKDLNEKDIFPRRYFYPSLNTIPYVNGKLMPISESIAKRVLCLPLFEKIEIEILEYICKIANQYES